MIAPPKAPSFKVGKTLREAGHGWVGTARAFGLEGDIRLPGGIDISVCRRLWCVVFARLAAYRVARWCSRGCP